MPKALRLLSDTHLELTDASLPEVCKRLSRPAYDRAGLSPSIVHIGVGGFHRAHQAVYLDELACRGISTDWGVVGAGLHGRKMKEALEQQAACTRSLSAAPTASKREWSALCSTTCTHPTIRRSCDDDWRTPTPVS